MSNSIKKAFIVTLSVLTATWSVGVSLFAPLAVAAAPQGAAVMKGDLIKASLPSVYYVGANGKRYVFPNEKTFKTWWSGFSAVKTISDSELASVAIGGNATYRPGSKLVKITTDPKVYMVGSKAMLYAIASESTAMELYGSNWNTKIDDVPDAFFTNYTVASTTVATAMGALPAGTLVMYQGSYYLVGDTMAHKIIGSTSMISMVYSSVVMISNDADFTAWVGMSSSAVSSSITESDIMAQVSPDRSGAFEGGMMNDQPLDGVSLNVIRKATDLQLASTSSQSFNVARFELCFPTSTRIDELNLSSGAGTVGFDNIFAYFEGPSGLIYELSGTLNNSVNASFTASDSDEMYSGCGMWNFFASTNQTSGRLKIDLTSVETPSAAAINTFTGKTLVDATPVSIAASDLADFTLSNAVPSGSVDADGTTMNQIISVQFNVSNNDLYVPYITFELSGDIVVSNPELRINGAAVSTSFTRVDDFYTFSVPEAKRLFREGNHTWELWAKVDGEAGQTFTPGSGVPFPFQYAYDAGRNRGGASVTGAAVAGDPYALHPGLMIAPAITRLVATTVARTITGATITAESKPIDSSKNSMQQGCTVGTESACNLDSDQTSGATNQVVGIFKLRVRGSEGTLSSVTYSVVGTHAAKGFTNCQVKIGQRTDKANFDTVDIKDFQLQNFGAEASITTALSPRTVTSNKKMNIGDWLLIFECDIITAGAAYANLDVMNIRLDIGTANFNFDTGGTVAFPAANVAATTTTIRLLTAITVNTDNTIRYIVANSKGRVVGTFTIVGPTQEDVLVTSLGVTFAAGLSGAAGCTTVTLANAALTEIATSQTLNAAGTLTFSTSFTVVKNTEYQVNIICNQASSAPTPATVTTATTLATLSLTGKVSNQAVNATPAVAGASVIVAANGTVTATLGTNQPAELIGPDQSLLLMTVTAAASINEPQYITSLIITLAAGSTATVNELATINISIEGAIVQGVQSAAATQICSRAVTGTTITCTFSDGDIKINPSNTAVITVMAKGNTVGNIGFDTTPTDGIITPTIASTGAVLSGITSKGVDSQLLANPTGATALTGRVVTPAGASLRVVSKAIPSTTLPGQNDMVLAKRDVIVGSVNVQLNQVAGQCVTSDTTNVCLPAVGTDTVDLVLDNTVIASAQQLVAGSPRTYTHTGLTNLMVPGTHNLESRLDAPGCTTSDTVQLTTNSFNVTIGSQVFASLVARIADFNIVGGNNMQHPSNLCG